MCRPTEVAHPVGAESNEFYQILADWSLILKDTSLGQVSPAPAVSSPQNTCERPVKGRQMYGAQADGKTQRA